MNDDFVYMTAGDRIRAGRTVTTNEDGYLVEAVSMPSTIKTRRDIAEGEEVRVYADGGLIG